MNLKRWLLLALIAAIVMATIVSAQDDDDEAAESHADVGKPIEEVADGVDAEDAAGDIADNADDDDKETNSYGIRAGHHFVSYADLKVPAGERVEILVPISSAPQNPTYEVALVAGNIALLDHSRTIQNFSAQVYQRTVEGGETVTVKYSVTPDALLDPLEYAFVVVAYLRNRDDNSTIVATAFNGTMVVQDPLGFDFKGAFSIVAVLGSVIGGAYFYFTTRAAARPAPRRAQAVETGTKDKSFDPEFVDKTHIAYAERAASGPRRNRSASK